MTWLNKIFNYKEVISFERPKKLNVQFYGSFISLIKWIFFFFDAALMRDSRGVAGRFYYTSRTRKMKSVTWKWFVTILIENLFHLAHFIREFVMWHPSKILCLRSRISPDAI